MYGWIWRRIPFQQWQFKSLVSVVLAGAFAALLWYKVFPAVEPILPFDDVQVETTDPAGDRLEQQQPSTAPSTRPSNPVPTRPAGTTGTAPQQLPS